MGRFLLQRLLSALGVSFGVVSLVFLLVHWVPGDPVEAMLGEAATAADRAALSAELGLDRPLAEQYLAYLAGVVRGELGVSIVSRQPVAALLAERLPATVALAAAALAVALAIALPCGLTAALRQGGAWDRAVLVFSTLALAVPSFWLGPLLILVFALWLGWLPVGGTQGTGALVLPALTLGLGMAAFLARMLRTALLEVAAEDYVRTARAKGLSEPAVWLRHLLANAALPLATALGLQLGGLLGGAVITETVFGWPGLGLLTVEAIQSRDHPVLGGCVLVISLSYVLVNTLTDVVCGWLDPRARLGG